MNKLRKKSIKGIFRRIRRRLAIWFFLPSARLESTMRGRSLTLQGWCRLLHPNQSKALDTKYHRKIEWWIPDKSTLTHPTASDMLFRQAIDALKELTKELRRQRNKRRHISNRAGRAGLSSPNLSKRKKQHRQKSPT